MTTQAPPRLTTLPEGARLVLRPVGYVVRRPSRADDLSVVNGARASFAKHKGQLTPEDVMTPEEADARNASLAAGERPVQAGLVYRLLGQGHETPTEQHGLLVAIEDAPASLRNLVPDEVDAVHHGDRVSFPWTCNLRHAMTLHRRARRSGEHAAVAVASALLLRFHEQGMEHGVSAYLRSQKLDLDVLRAEAGPGLRHVRVLANPPAERDCVAAIRAHLGPLVQGLDDAAVVGYCARHRPNLLNLWVFTWQIRAIIHVFWDLVRHRKSSPNGESGRYSVLMDEWIALAPDEVRTQKGHPLSYERGVADPAMAAEFIEDLNRFNAEGVRLYKKWVERKVAREMCSWFETLAKFRTFVWTFRGLGLANMVGLRNHPTALHELRLYAAEMEADLKAEAPLLHAAFEDLGRHAP
ncbi:MAG TPA: FAD-dependent thymidylate synthase [Candidatus Thermoplasmatota archaeon]|nr:FAD-dependent thymidylate synthase [Candidatus Thermoplasmatota archaeon]